MQNNNRIKKRFIFTKLSKITKILIAFSIVMLLSSILTIILIREEISHITFELKGLKIEVENGNENKISLKEDAFKVIDDTQIEFDDGLNNTEIEKILDNHKYSEETKIDGILDDQKKNTTKFNELWGIENGFEDIQDIDFIINKDFKNRLIHTHKEHIFRIDWNYFNQRGIPKIGNIICVPSSAVILLNALGYKIDIEKLINFFAESNDIKDFAKKEFPYWINKYINENKLYQITGVFTFGLNLYLEKNFPHFPYELDYDYWDIHSIAKYVEKFGLMSATYFPSYVLRNERKGGHMILITKVYKDFDGNIISFGIVDPFGNPNVKYRGVRGWDGKNVIINMDMMKKVMKSYRDDHKKGVDYLYRVLYFKDKE